MRLAKALAVTIGLALLSAVPTVDNPEAWKGLTPAQIARVKKGEVLILDQDTSGSGEQKRFIRAAILFNQPIEKAWLLFRKTENQARYLPDLESNKLVSRDAKGDQVDFHVSLLGISIDYRIHHVYDDANCQLSWGLDPSYDNDMKRVDGFWHLYKYDDTHTLGRYGTQVEVMSFIPEFVMTRLTRSNLPVNMEAVKKYIDSGGTYIKPGFKG
jgi:hypothetical protein